MRTWMVLVAVTCALTLALLAVPGCGDDVKKVKTIETHQESQPEMVSPGEPIVD